MMYRFEKHSIGHMSRLILNEIPIKVVIENDKIEKTLLKLKSINKPMFCSICSNVVEYTDKAAFVEDYGFYARYYCGCRGWD